MEILVAFLATIIVLQSGALLFALFKFYPGISKANVHRATTAMHMDITAASMDPARSQDLAQEAEDEINEKPFGVDSATWERATLFAQDHGCTIDDALAMVQSEDPSGDVGPRGA